MRERGGSRDNATAIDSPENEPPMMTTCMVPVLTGAVVGADGMVGGGGAALDDLLATPLDEMDGRSFAASGGMGAGCDCGTDDGGEGGEAEGEGEGAGESESEGEGEGEVEVGGEDEGNGCVVMAEKAERWTGAGRAEGW